MERMKTDGEWAGQVELIAAAQALRVNIVVHQHEHPSYRIECAPDAAGGGSKAKPAAPPREIHVSYHDGEHYNSVHAKGAPREAAKRVWATGGRFRLEIPAADQTALPALVARTTMARTTILAQTRTTARAVPTPDPAADLFLLPGLSPPQTRREGKACAPTRLRARRAPPSPCVDVVLLVLLEHGDTFEDSTRVVHHRSLGHLLHVVDEERFGARCCVGHARRRPQPPPAWAHHHGEAVQRVPRRRC